jgi:hypothetical protein
MLVTTGHVPRALDSAETDWHSPKPSQTDHNGQSLSSTGWGRDGSGCAGEARYRSPIVKTA